MIGVQTHELKTWPEYFQAVKLGIKRFELRKNDRDFKTGDLLLLREYNPKNKRYSGDKILCHIEYILDGGNFGLEDGFACLSIRRDGHFENLLTID